MSHLFQFTVPVNPQWSRVIRMPRHGTYETNPNRSHPDVEIIPVLTCVFFLNSIVIAIASSIDLNTLDSLSRTCRLVHHGLLQYRSILLSSTLRCCNETVAVDPAETFRYRARAGNWFYMEDGRNYSGKSGDCARDMVGECRRCSQVICRVSAYPPKCFLPGGDRIGD